MLKIIMTSMTLSLCFILWSCTPNTAFTGINALYEHHSISNTAQNHMITMQANNELAKKRELYNRTNVTIATYNYVVLLAGQAPTAADKQQVETIVRTVPGIKRLVNDIEVIEPTSVTQRIHDSWLTTQILANLVTEGNIDPSRMKVVTENDKVYLMGIVPKDEGELAINISRRMAGVKKVVTLFQYIPFDNA